VMTCLEIEICSNDCELEESEESEILVYFF
jgi:hypothetical protein